MISQKELNISSKELNNSQKDNKEENFEEIKSNYCSREKSTNFDNLNNSEEEDENFKKNTKSPLLQVFINFIRN